MGCGFSTHRSNSLLDANAARRPAVGIYGLQSSRQILGVISPPRAEQMLMEWVNIDLDGVQNANVWGRLFRRYPEIPSVPVTDIVPVTEANFDRFHQQMEMADMVASYLSKAWDAADLRHFDWYTWKAQSEYAQEAASAKHNVPPSHVHQGDDQDTLRRMAAAIAEGDEPPAVITPIEAAIFHLRHNRNRALHCPNPECPAPYFFSTKKGQKYCSLECAKPSQRESKRKWWAENRAKG